MTRPTYDTPARIALAMRAMLDEHQLAPRRWDGMPAHVATRLRLSSIRLNLFRVEDLMERTRPDGGGEGEG